MSNSAMTTIQISASLEANALNFSYPDKKLFRQFTARFAPGISLLRGGDGRGKSTLLRLMAGTLSAQSGQLKINGIDLQSQPAKYKANLFFAEPRSDAFDALTALDYFQLQRSVYAEFNDTILAQITAGLGLDAHLHKQLFILSTGSKRKVFLAAALAASAAITLLDEPFAALDAASIACLLHWLKSSATASRAWVIADYTAPAGLFLVQTVELGD